jgi:TRAP-type mannitol/chloroaromatic compound transport system permease small subunit
MMSRQFERNVLTTYRMLRVAMIPLLLILVVAPTLESTRGQDCLLGSISAYYYTPVRGAFVFSLAALGACLIAYKGNDAVEDVLLNFAGFMAFVVALVPTTVDGSCPTKYVNVVADANTADAVRNNVLTLLIVSVVFLLLYGFMPRQVQRAKTRKGITDGTPSTEEPSSTAGPVRRWLRRLRDRTLTWAEVLGALAVLIVLVELALFVFWPETFKDIAHGISAGTMVLGVLGVMVANAYSFARAGRERGAEAARPWTNRYGVTAAATIVMIGAAIVIFGRGGYLVLVVELVVIVGFIAFWYMQTRELWFYPTREQKSVDVDQVVQRSAGSVTRMPSAPPPPASGGLVPDEPAGPSEGTTPDESAGAARPSRSEVYKAL